MLNLSLPTGLETTVVEDKIIDVDEATSIATKEISTIKIKVEVIVVNFLGLLFRILFLGHVTGAE